MREQKEYYCDHCSFHCSDKEYMENHEKEHRDLWRVYLLWNKFGGNLAHPNELAPRIEIEKVNVCTRLIDEIFLWDRDNAYVALAMYTPVDKTDKEAVDLFVKKADEYLHKLDGLMYECYNRIRQG